MCLSCLSVSPSPTTLETNSHFQPHLSKTWESGESTWLYRRLLSSQVAPKSAEVAVFNSCTAANHQLCIHACAFAWIQKPNCKLPDLNILVYLLSSFGRVSQLVVLLGTEFVFWFSLEWPCLMKNIVCSRPQHYNLHINLWKRKLSLSFPVWGFTVAFLSVYITAEAGLLINVDGLSLLLPEWESSVEKPRKRKESLRKYQLQGEKLAEMCVVLLFGLYLATSSEVGECLRGVQECSLRAPFWGREDVFMPFTQREDRGAKVLSGLPGITGVHA